MAELLAGSAAGAAAGAAGATAAGRGSGTPRPGRPNEPLAAEPANRPGIMPGSAPGMAPALDPPSLTAALVLILPGCTLSVVWRATASMKPRARSGLSSTFCWRVRSTSRLFLNRKEICGGVCGEDSAQAAGVCQMVCC